MVISAPKSFFTPHSGDCGPSGLGIYRPFDLEEKEVEFREHYT
jgi:hypothetical protein